MKAVFVGGGAHRLLPILRSAMAEPRLFDGGEIHLYDLNVARAETLGRLAQKSPEFAKIRCKISWGDSLDRALPGADVVGVILMAGSPESYALGFVPSHKHGFIASDNVSPNGAFLGLKGAPILLDLARKMEKHCPRAWLLDFANPIAVLSGMVNRHTKIQALGLCAGFTNHQWDLSRLLGRDEQNPAFRVEAAGVNHLSFILKGDLRGKDLFGLLDRAFAKGEPKIRFQPHWNASGRANIARSVRNLYRFYRELGVLIFSTEGDGMDHLCYDEAVERSRNTKDKPTRASALAQVKRNREARAKANAAFAAHLGRDLTPAFWREAGKNHTVFGREDQDIFVKAMRGIAGIEKVRLVTSRLNGGAIEGMPDDFAVEYSQVLEKGKIRPEGRYRLPAVVHGLISGLTAHQTMLGDAAATGDPKLLAQALLAYPVAAYTRRARALYKDLLAINRDQIAKPLRSAAQYL